MEMGMGIDIRVGLGLTELFSRISVWDERIEIVL